MKKIAKIVLGAQHWILILSTAIMIGIITVGAFMRYVLKTDFYGSEELVMVFAFWQYFIGMSCAGQEDSHITADMIKPLIKFKRGKAAVDIVRHTLSLIICVLGTVWCFQMIQWYLRDKALTAIFRLPFALTQFPILLGFLLWCFYIAMHLIHSVIALKEGEAAQ